MRANGFPSPVVFLTAHHRLSDRLPGFSAGGDDYLPKPFHLAELAARLRAALKRAAPPSASTAADSHWRQSGMWSASEAPAPSRSDTGRVPSPGRLPATVRRDRLPPPSGAPHAGQPLSLVALTMAALLMLVLTAAFNDALLDANVWIYADGRLLEEPPNACWKSRRTPAVSPASPMPSPGAAGGGASPPTSTALSGCAPKPLSTDKSGALGVTALDLSPYRSSADALLLGSLALDVVTLVCTYALTRLTVGRALRPVRTMTDQATQWSAAACVERFASMRQPAELARLGTSLDAILDRVRALLRHERQLLWRPEFHPPSSNASSVRS
jgi:hypothetical protein